MDKEKLLFQSQAFCLMPWIHLHIQGNGEIKPCCVANQSIGKIENASIQSVLDDSAKLKELKRNLLKDQKNSICNSCYQREETGNSSIRIETNQKFAHFFDQVIANEINFPVYWDIRFSNICNLKCRTCWHGNSSQWFEEAKKLRRNVSEQAIIYPIPQPAILQQELLENIDHVEEIYFAGGEPLLMKEHYQLLDVLIQKKKLDVHLRYNTNFTTFEYKEKSIFDYWKQFERVEVLASLDAADERGEYLRKNLIWKDIEEKRKQMLQEVPHVVFKLAPTLSIFNVLHFPDFHQEWVEKELIQIDDVYVNLLEFPAFFNMKVLPKALKEQVRKRYQQHFHFLTTNQASEEMKKSYEDVLNYLFAESWEGKLSKLRKEVKLLDDLRNERFKAVFPELKSLF